MTTLYSLFDANNRRYADIAIKNCVVLLLSVLSVNLYANDKLVIKSQKNTGQFTVANNKTTIKSTVEEDYQESAGSSQPNMLQANISQINALQPKEALERRLSPEALNKLQRELYEYNSTVDPGHIQIEERRKVLYKRLVERFEQCDPDNDGTMSRVEAAEFMPQIARHFSSVDTNNDELISLDELAAAQNKAVERRMITRVEPSRTEPAKYETRLDNADNLTAKRKLKAQNYKR